MPTLFRYARPLPGTIMCGSSHEWSSEKRGLFGQRRSRMIINVDVGNEIDISE